MSDRSSQRHSARHVKPGAARDAIGAATSAIALLCGCHEYSTEIRVKDPSEVALYAGKTGGQTDMVLPPGKDPKTAFYLPLPPISASREPTGALRLSCSACEFGDVTLVEPSGALRPIEAEAGDIASPAARARGEFEVWQSLVTSTEAYGGGGTTTIVTNSIAPVLKTPWSNVVEVRERRTPMRFVGWLQLIPGALLTGTGLLVMPYSSKTGAILLVPGLGFDASWIYHAFFPSKTTDVYAAAK